LFVSTRRGEERGGEKRREETSEEKTRREVKSSFINSQKRAQAMFGEDLARFYAAEVIIALEHLHSMGIAHR